MSRASGGRVVRSRPHRHGNPIAWDQLTSGVPSVFLAKRFRVSTSTIETWRDGKRPVPWWVVELLMLDDWMREDTRRQIGVGLARRALAYGEHQPLRRSITELVFEALDQAKREGHVISYRTDVRKLDQVERLGVFAAASLAMKVDALTAFLAAPPRTAAALDAPAD